MRILLSFVLAIPLVLISFCQEPNPLSIFEPFMGETWEAEGTWIDGSPFQQEIEMKYDLDSNLVIVHTSGLKDPEDEGIGTKEPRNSSI